MSPKTSTSEGSQNGSASSSGLQFTQPATISRERFESSESTEGLSIVIPTLRQGFYYDNVIRDIKACRKEIEDNFGNWEIITVENMLVNPAWNKGVEEAKYDKVMIINDDIVFHPKTFEWFGKTVEK